MLLRNTILFCLILLYSCGDSTLDSALTSPQLSPEDRNQTALLPLPYSLDIGDEFYTLTSQINWTFNGPTDHVLKQSFDRLSTELTAYNMAKGNQEWTIEITTSQKAPDTPFLGIDESYELQVSNGLIQLSADNGIGIERGIQTLRQLIQFNDGGYHIPECTIYDQPSYSWRGIMIDVSRHFISKEVLLQNIAAMAAVKMNVLHLHLSDNQGFRVESKVYPKLHEVGSKGAYYSQDDIKEIVAYAAHRGIRIVPEFDLPGHASALLTAYPAYGSKVDKTYTIEDGYGVYPASIDPTNQDFYLFYASLIKEMIDLFPDAYIHIGSDEVLPSDWEANPAIMKFIADKQLSGFKDLQTYFNLRLADILRMAGKKMIAWDEALHPELSKINTTIQAWRTHDVVNDAIVSGSPTILSTGWYLDHKKSAAEMYQVDPKVAKDALHVDPDPNHWSAYELSSTHPMISQKGILFLFGTDDNIRGLVTLMDRNSTFDNATLKDNRLSFSYNNAAGLANASFLMSQDKIEGALNMSFISIPLNGKKIGGHDMAEGLLLPNFKKAAIPTPEQQELILGGEACIWAEWVDDNTINSRIWPRTAAIAEKLWSPIEWTDNADDLYRRIDLLSPQLTEIGVIDDSYQLKTISRWSKDPTEIRELYKLIQLLEEVKGYDRWSFHFNQNINTPLNRVADIIPAESLVSWKFNQTVESYLKTKDDALLSDINKAIQSWIPLYGNLKTLMKDHPQLSEVEFLALALSDLAKIAERQIDGGTFSQQELDYYNQLKREIVIARGGALLPCAKGLISLIDQINSAR